MREQRPIAVCASSVRQSMQQRVHNAGLTAAALALSGLCLVGSEISADTAPGGACI